MSSKRRVRLAACLAPTAGGRAGFSLVEMLFVVTIFGALFASIALVSTSATSSYEEGSMRSDLEMRTHRTVERIARELESAGRGTLAPAPVAPFGASVVDYRPGLGWVGGANTFDDPCRLELVMETGEVDDGLDNDSDGLVDEGMIVWTENPGMPEERTAVWCRNVREFLDGETAGGGDENGNGLVDERGLSFDLVGDVLTVRLSLERRDVDGRVYVSTAESAIRLRN